MGPRAAAAVALALVSIGLAACGTPPAQEDAAVESIGEWSISRDGVGSPEAGDVEGPGAGAIELRHRASQPAWIGELLGRLHPAWSRVGRPSVVVGPGGERVLPRAFGLARESDARRLAQRLEAALGLGPRTT